MSTFIQKYLHHLCVEVQFDICNSNELVHFLVDSYKTGANFAFSIDVEDFFYSVPEEKLINAVRTVVEEAGSISLQNVSRESLNSFIHKPFNILPQLYVVGIPSPPVKSFSPHGISTL